MLIAAMQTSRKFKASVPVGDCAWYNCGARYHIPEPMPPPYTSQGSRSMTQCSTAFPADGRSLQGVPSLSSTAFMQTYATVSTFPELRPDHHNLTAAGNHRCRTYGGNASQESESAEEEEDATDDEDMDSDKSELGGQLCRFGRPCGVVLTDTSEQAIHEHLVQYHTQDMRNSVES
ncbi:hypothetical protein DAEQUDRAFT_732382 [Daedalea quercina L-15889]|uniref:Uncharacterized protein n=1 Tax=Daedalea quercina L-15889 TaxID=1314783 RepID=A0A165LMC0_9APHY|nr:hypothetical protein DAEQUDRAFT_732382 [Daedalea quercina L-15889]